MSSATKTLDGYCCRKTEKGYPVTLYIEESAIPILVEDCRQGEGEKYIHHTELTKRDESLREARDALKRIYKHKKHNDTVMHNLPCKDYNCPCDALFKKDIKTILDALELEKAP